MSDTKCVYCLAPATRTGIERDADDNARTYDVCDDCGDECDRTERRRQRRADYEYACDQRSDAMRGR